MKPRKERNAKKTRIQKIAAGCLGALFLVLLLKTILAGDPEPVSPVRADARALDAGPARTSSPPDKRGRAPQDPLPIHWTPAPPDTGPVAVPPNPFKVSVRLREEITGIKQKARNVSSQSTRPKRIEVKLRGIMADHSSGEHIALIDDELLRAGDRYKGFTLVEIGPDSVTLDDGRERRVLLLEEP